MKYGLTVLLNIFMLVGCATVAPKVTLPKDSKEFTELNQTVLIVENNVSIIEKDVLEDVNIILNVFSDELYFEKDKVGGDKTKIVIKHLDAFEWEKKALQKAYAKDKQLWSKEQSEDLKKIIEEDKYLALCSDQRYWDNLQFEESEPERDILHSILLIKYLNNLSYGCVQWAESKVKDENFKEHINTKHLLSLLPHGVIVGKVFALYVPHTKKFKHLLKEHHLSLSRDSKEEVLRLERLELENYKRAKSNPEYNIKRK
ncbi:MAG: Unknown protein [uncultured Sulfurovum sp.]|uniref:Lipoprotein n=1 Tax=uncultured Sulfurovum sp. TaxID=269237 RepID=A0A6S6U1Z7_9BACT|nr:MAG: Unknown protein [uncultured Sulfurovum sp.]